MTQLLKFVQLANIFALFSLIASNNFSKGWTLARVISIKGFWQGRHMH